MLLCYHISHVLNNSYTYRLLAVQAEVIIRPLATDHFMRAVLWSW